MSLVRWDKDISNRSAKCVMVMNLWSVDPSRFFLCKEFILLCVVWLCTSVTFQLRYVNAIRWEESLFLLRSGKLTIGKVKLSRLSLILVWSHQYLSILWKRSIYEADLVSVVPLISNSQGYMRYKYTLKWFFKKCVITIFIFKGKSLFNETMHSIFQLSNKFER